MRRLLGIQAGGDRILTEVSDELGIGLILENDRPEWAYLRGELLGGAATVLGASALNNNHIQLYNPASSGVLVVIERIFYNSLTAQFVTVRRTATALGLVVTNIGTRDTRTDQVPSTTLRTLAQAGIAAGTVIGGRQVVANVWNNHPGGILAEGRGIYVVAETVNTELTAEFLFRVRSIEEAEK